MVLSRSQSQVRDSFLLLWSGTDWMNEMAVHEGDVSDVGETERQ